MFKKYYRKLCMVLLIKIANHYILEKCLTMRMIGKMDEVWDNLRETNVLTGMLKFATELAVEVHCG